MNLTEFNLTFLGGAGTVTGSKHLVSAQGRKILIDCGMFQGLKEHRLLNWQALPIEGGARSIDAVILTHAHLDHTGYLPLLLKQGFHGPIYCSEPTAELTRLILLDSAKIQEEDAEHANRYGYSKHKPALPLYGLADTEAVFKHLQPLETDRWFRVAGGMEARLTNSGHILGSTFVELLTQNGLLAFSGDLGRASPVTLNPRKSIAEADALIIESTYGDRCHPSEEVSEALARLINQALSRKGHVLIPTFAIGRTQDILHLLATLRASHRIPEVPIYLDSPMADRATAVFDRYPQWHRLSSPDLRRLSATYHHVASIEESMALCESPDPAIVLAGSGMMTGGRIKHHLMTRLPDERNMLIVVGYQAAGTLGRFLREGAQEVKLFGKYVPVKARIEEISALSAHADQQEILDWISGFKKTPARIFIVHGEPHAAEGLRVRISDRFGVQAHIAKLAEVVGLPR